MRILPDASAVAAAVADLLVATGQAAIAERKCFRVALSGGNTPRTAYQLLAQAPRRDALNWDEVCVYFGDERCVPPENAESNYRMASEAFLDAVPIPPGNVHRIKGEIDPGHAANQYASILRADLEDPPRFDLVLLGLGPDGHTASLFPGTPPDTDGAELVRAVYAESQDMWRVTITPKLINLAHTVAFAIEGAEKADILATVFEGPIDPTRYPAQVVHPRSGKLLWLVDRAAAGKLATVPS